MLIWRLFLAAVSLSGGPPALSHAQGSATATPGERDTGPEAEARALFREGLVHADAQRWDKAAETFERARALRPTPEISYNLTTALVRLGDIARASDLLRQIASDRGASSEVKRAARARLDEIRPRLAYLRVEPPDDQLHRTAAVVIDGRPLPDLERGLPLPVNPASHNIELRYGATLVGSRQVTLREGEHRTVKLGAELPASASGDHALGLPAESAQLAAAPASEGLLRRTPTWAWVALGAVVVGVTTAALIASRSDPAPSGNVGTWTLGAQ